MITCEKVEKSQGALIFCALRCRKVEPQARQSCGCGAIWSGERSKIARRCSTKHMSKSKCRKHLTSRALLEVEW